MEKVGPERGPDGNLIEMEGKSWIEFECGEKKIKGRVVFGNLKRPLLGYSEVMGVKLI